MVEIRNLMKFTSDDQASFGQNGYTSNCKYELVRNTNESEISFILKLTEMPIPYAKKWKNDGKTFDTYAKIISGRNSLGAYDNERLIGVLIAEKREWNNSLYIEFIEVAVGYRGRGVGAMLLKKLVHNAKLNKIRIITLETQNTNVPAINFYRKTGFEFTGLNTTIYDKHEDKNEVAIYMSMEI